METNLELKRSSKQHQNSRTEKHKNGTSQGDQSSNNQDRSKVNNLVGSSNCDLKYELGLDAQNKDSVKADSLSNRQGKCLEGNTSKDDELVKHMSNLPNYLQRLDSVNFQGNTLNIGVLDWSRLEKWKDKTKNSLDSVGETASSSSSKFSVSSFSSGMFSKASDRLNNQRSSASNAQKKMTWSSSSFENYVIDRLIEKDKRNYRDQVLNSKRGSLLSSQRDPEVSCHQGQNLRSQDIEVKRKAQELQEFGSCMKRGEENSERSSPSSSTTVNLEGSSIENSNNAERGKTHWRQKELQGSNDNYDHQKSATEPMNIVLLHPKNIRRNSFVEVSRSLNPGTSATKDLIGCGHLTRQSKNSDQIGYVPMESQSAKLHNDTPEQSRLQTIMEGDMKHNVQSSLKTQANEISSDVSHKLPHSIEKPEMLPEHIPVEKRRLNIKMESMYSVADKPEEKYGSGMNATSARLRETLKILDQETAELATKNSRNPSSTRRFSFNLPLAGRSFSFKEGSGVPQLTSSHASVKSRPTSSGTSAHLQSRMAEKDNGNNRAKSSPFRRLLDPLLRSKEANRSHSRETVQPLEGKFDLSFCPGRSRKKEKHKKSEIEATLKLTIRNGIPLYKFVIDNDSNIFAATMKNFTVPGKDNSGQNYTFYSINEIKKKCSAWLAQGSKGKNARYSYNVVGQMKVSSYSTSDLDAQKTNSISMVTESVLLDVDQRQADKESPVLFRGKELAAVVIRIPNEILSHGEQLSIEEKEFLTSHVDGFPGDSCDLRRTGVFHNTTVILPDGVHTLPFEGEPSPLISRWKSGGSCDCEGWDVGCRLHVFSNEKKSFKDQETSGSRSISPHFKLFDQVRNRQEKPVFSLAPSENGIYSVKFNTSISLLQAFFISVAVLSNRQLSSVSDFSKLAEGILQDPELSGIDQEMKPTIDSVQSLGKYVSLPYSPIGRV